MAEEEVVLAELERYWSGRSESELAVYDEYHEIVSIVMKIGDRQQLADVQRLLGNTVRQWLLGSDPNDPVVQVICRYMLEPDRVLAPGPPAMTEVAATAYGELIAYARLLAEDPAAVPGDIDPDEVAEIVALLVRDWALFTDAVREQGTHRSSGVDCTEKVHHPWGRCPAPGCPEHRGRAGALCDAAEPRRRQRRCKEHGDGFGALQRHGAGAGDHVQPLDLVPRLEGSADELLAV